METLVCITKRFSSLFSLSRGCVTPLQLGQWKDDSGGDMELIDGYDELSTEEQKNVKRCLEQGHVDDKDWRGVSIENYFKGFPTKQS